MSFDPWIADRMSEWGKRRVTAPMRERAALLCALMASSDEKVRDGDPYPAVDFDEPCKALGVAIMANDDSAELARLAFWSTTNEGRAAWAEAEALLRTGWLPPTTAPSAGSVPTAGPGASGSSRG